MKDLGSSTVEQIGGGGVRTTETIVPCVRMILCTPAVKMAGDGGGGEGVDVATRGL